VIAHGRLGGARSDGALRRARAHFPTYELPRLDRPISPRLDAAAVRDFAALCRTVKPDVVHTHSSKAGLIGRIGAPRGVVLLHSIHGWGHTPLDSRARRGVLVAAERLAARRTTRLIAGSDDVRSQGLALRIGRPAQYEVIGAPVDLWPSDPVYQRSRAAARERLQLPPEAEVIGWVGRFSAQKDPDTLVAVISAMLAQRPTARAVLVGEGPLQPVVERALAAHIASERAVLVKATPALRSLYPAFDVLVHPSLWEGGHPRVVREALAERVPGVSARVSGTWQTLSDQRLGALVTARDVRAFVNELTAILDSPARRAPIDERALEPLRASAEEPYRLMRELYRRELGCSAPPR